MRAEVARINAADAAVELARYDSAMDNARDGEHTHRHHSAVLAMAHAQAATAHATLAVAEALLAQLEVRTTAGHADLLVLALDAAKSTVRAEYERRTLAVSGNGNSQDRVGTAAEILRSFHSGELDALIGAQVQATAGA